MPAMACRLVMVLVTLFCGTVWATFTGLRDPIGQPISSNSLTVVLERDALAEAESRGP